MTSRLVSIVCSLFLLVLLIVFGTANIIEKAHEKPPSSAFFTKFQFYVTGFPKVAWTFLTGDYLRIYLVDRGDVAGSENWTANFPFREDAGFLLFSGYDDKIKSTAVRLVRVSDGAVLLDWDVKSHGAIGLSRLFAPATVVHPLLIPGGDIVVNLDAKLVRMRTCYKDLIWKIDQPVHHSISLTGNGELLTAGLMPANFFGNPTLANDIVDNSILRIGIDGKILSEDSFGKILVENGFTVLMMGHFGMTENSDPLHVNEITEAASSTHYWEKGDLLVSARHMSSVFLYRPSTRKIIWSKTGPWMNQHSAAFVGDHQIMVFNNNVVTVDRATSFLQPGDSNQVMLFDFENGAVTQPYQAVLNQLRPRTVTQGRAQILGDGSLFVEESSNGRMFKATATATKWSFLNIAGPRDLAQLLWSRYYTRQDVAALLPQFNLDKPPATYSGCLN
jgi:Arylsulfotransferase (ASST)